MEYKTAIIDECGKVMFWCIDMSDEEVDEVLDIHPEWRVQCITIDY